MWKTWQGVETSFTKVGGGRDRREWCIGGKVEITWKLFPRRVYLLSLSPSPPPLSLSVYRRKNDFRWKWSNGGGAKKWRSAASCIGSKQIGQDPINSWKRRGAINDANGRPARIKKAAYERRAKCFFFFSVPFFASSRAPLHLERFLIFLLWKREERRECDRVRLARGCGSCIGWTSTFFD